VLICAVVKQKIARVLWLRGLEEPLRMRSLFTALAFLVILLAVIPAVRRSFYPARKEQEVESARQPGKGQGHRSE
jgi:hypothetical protein